MCSPENIEIYILEKEKSEIGSHIGSRTCDFAKKHLERDIRPRNVNEN